MKRNLESNQESTPHEKKRKIEQNETEQIASNETTVADEEANLQTNVAPQMEQYAPTYYTPSGYGAPAQQHTPMPVYGVPNASFAEFMAKCQFEQIIADYIEDSETIRKSHSAFFKNIANNETMGHLACKTYICLTKYTAFLRFSSDVISSSDVFFGLHNAIGEGHYEFTQLILASASDDVLNILGENGDTILHLAVRNHSSDEVIGKIIKRKSDMVNAVNKDGDTALNLVVNDDDNVYAADKATTLINVMDLGNLVRSIKHEKEGGLSFKIQEVIREKVVYVIEDFEDKFEEHTERTKNQTDEEQELEWKMSSYEFKFAKLSQMFDFQYLLDFPYWNGGNGRAAPIIDFTNNYIAEYIAKRMEEEQSNFFKLIGVCKTTGTSQISVLPLDLISYIFSYLEPHTLWPEFFDKVENDSAALLGEEVKSD